MVSGYPVSTPSFSAVEGLRLDKGFVGDRTRHIVYSIPEGVASDADIKKTATDVSTP